MINESMCNDVAFLKIRYDLGNIELKRTIHVTYILHIDFAKVILMAVLALRSGIALAGALSCRERPPRTSADSAGLSATLGVVGLCSVLCGFPPTAAISKILNNRYYINDEFNELISAKI
jgi:hypothetical protein